MIVHGELKGMGGKAAANVILLFILNRSG